MDNTVLLKSLSVGKKSQQKETKSTEGEAVSFCTLNFDICQKVKYTIPIKNLFEVFSIFTANVVSTFSCVRPHSLSSGLHGLVVDSTLKLHSAGQDIKSNQIKSKHNTRHEEATQTHNKTDS